MNDLLKIEDLSISIRKSSKAIISNVNLSLKAGEALVLLGQSGSGKTMTCQAIIDLLNLKKYIVKGGIRFEGRDLITMNRKEKRKIYGAAITFIPQNPMTALDPSMRIGRQMSETLALNTEIERNEGLIRITDSLLRAGLAHPELVCNSFPYMLSGGMLQRVLLAMAMMVNTRLIIADEPTTALDVVNRNTVVDALAALKNQGTAVLMVTHDFSAAAQLGGRLLIMKDGQIVEQGMMERVLAHPRNPYTKALIEASILPQDELREGGVCC